MGGRSTVSQLRAHCKELQVECEALLDRLETAPHEVGCGEITLQLVPSSHFSPASYFVSMSMLSEISKILIVVSICSGVGVCMKIH